ncbi:hypothetical protein SAMCCGM7_pC2088 (plasmid) [Sinorhizobium americanum CCGM7]|nr:hypothetical protein SAMCCGM7_pC2088 [Sinorhizobium americanum CCGM7]
MSYGLAKSAPSKLAPWRGPIETANFFGDELLKPPKVPVSNAFGFQM